MEKYKMILDDNAILSYYLILLCGMRIRSPN